MTEDNFAQKMFKGSSFMFGRLIVSQVCSLISFVFLSRILTPIEWGVYILAGFIVSLFNIFLFIFSPGIEVFTARQIARFVSVSDMAKTRAFMTFAVKYKFLICAIAFFIAFLLSEIIGLLYKDPLIGSMVRILSFTLITSGLYSFFSFTFQGFHRFEYVFGLVSLQEISYVLMLYIIFLTSGALNSVVIGHVVVQTLVVLSGFMLFLRFLPAETISEKIPWKSQLRNLFEFGLPIVGASIIETIHVSARRIIISLIQSYDTIAYYNISSNIWQSMKNISGFITRPLLPTLSALDSQKDFDRIEITMNYLMRYLTIAACLVGGVLVFIMSFIFKLFLTEAYFWLVPYVQLMVVIGIFAGLGGIFGYWIYASGQTRIIPILSLLGISYSLPIFFAAFWYFGLFGGLLWTVISADIYFGILWFYVKKFSKLDISYKSLYPIILFLIAILVSYLLPFMILQIFSFLAIFSSLVILTKGLTKKDLELLTQLDTGSKQLNSLIGKILKKFGKILPE